jgi:hypothetical protein
VQALSDILCSGPPQCGATTLLCAAIMPAGQQSSESTAVAPQTRQPRLLSWPCPCGAGAAVAQGAPRLLATREPQAGGCAPDVTRALAPATPCLTRGCRECNATCVTRFLLHTTGCCGWPYRTLHGLVVTRGHRGDGPPPATIGARYSPWLTL